MGAATGIVGYLGGSLLAPLHVDILGYKLTSALIFDVGVYLAVLGVILASFNLLGRPRTAGGASGDAAADAPAPPPGPGEPAEPAEPSAREESVR